MPFEANPPGTEIGLADAHIAGGVVIMSALAPLANGGTAPALVYRFAKPDGTGFYPPILLVVADVVDVRKVADLTSDAVRAVQRSAS